MVKMETQRPINIPIAPPQVTIAYQTRWLNISHKMFQ